MASLNVDLDYFDHPKTKMLIASLGRDADVLPLRLWAYAGKYFARDGRLVRHSAAKIEAVIGWRGPKGECVKAMLHEDSRFLDEDADGTYVVHDWAEHQGHIAAYKTRAQNAARARWSGSDASRIASSNAPSIVKHASSNAPAVPSLQRSADPSLQHPPPEAAEGLDEPGERGPRGPAPPRLRVEPLSREAAAEESRRRQAVTQALTGQGVHPAKAALLAKRRSLTPDVVFEHASSIATMPGINDPAAFLVRTLERAG